MTGADGTYDYKAMAAGIVLAGARAWAICFPWSRRNFCIIESWMP